MQTMRTVVTDWVLLFHVTEYYQSSATASASAEISTWQNVYS